MPMLLALAVRLDILAAPFPEIAFVAIAVALLALGPVRWLLRARRRSKRIERLAEQLGPQYIARDRTVLRRRPFLKTLCLGTRGDAVNVLQGNYRGYRVEAFDFRPNFRLTFDTQNVSFERRGFSLFLLDHGADFPTVHITPKSVPGKLDRRLGYEALDFESVQFSDAFCVCTKDRKLAYALCHPRMMEYLLQHRDVSIVIEGNCLALHFPGLSEAEQIPKRLQQLVGIRKLAPNYLFQD